MEDSDWRHVLNVMPGLYVSERHDMREKHPEVVTALRSRGMNPDLGGAVVFTTNNAGGVLQALSAFSGRPAPYVQFMEDTHRFPPMLTYKTNMLGGYGTPTRSLQKLQHMMETVSTRSGIPLNFTALTGNENRPGLAILAMPASPEQLFALWVGAGAPSDLPKISEGRWLAKSCMHTPRVDASQGHHPGDMHGSVPSDAPRHARPFTHKPNQNHHLPA